MVTVYTAQIAYRPRHYRLHSTLSEGSENVKSSALDVRAIVGYLTAYMQKIAL